MTDQAPDTPRSRLERIFIRAFFGVIRRIAFRSPGCHEAFEIGPNMRISNPVRALLCEYHLEMRAAGLEHVGDFVSWRFMQTVNSYWMPPENDCVVIAMILIRKPLPRASVSQHWAEASTPYKAGPDFDAVITQRPAHANDANDESDEQQPEEEETPVQAVLDLTPEATVAELLSAHREAVAASDIEPIHVSPADVKELLCAIDRKLIDDMRRDGFA